jgi:hypothetical protein
MLRVNISVTEVNIIKCKRWSCGEIAPARCKLKAKTGSKRPAAKPRPHLNHNAPYAYPYRSLGQLEAAQPTSSASTGPRGQSKGSAIAVPRPARGLQTRHEGSTKIPTTVLCPPKSATAAAQGQRPKDPPPATASGTESRRRRSSLRECGYRTDESPKACSACARWGAAEWGAGSPRCRCYVCS